MESTHLGGAKAKAFTAITLLPLLGGNAGDAHSAHGLLGGTPPKRCVRACM